ncbi:FAD-binding oxidoreductase [Candidatus Uhrbacteria bacterium]|nr:FAD-binding oxidoreductase [Candidatus Uhrbacteria bacterium]
MKEECFWITSSPRTVFSENHVPRQVDVVVIGADTAGTTAAYELARAGSRVLLLDEHEVGSGMTAGSIGGLISLAGASLAECIRRGGFPRARRFADAVFSALESSRRLIEQERLVCALHESPTLLLGQTPLTAASVHEEYAAWRAVGTPVEWMESNDIRDAYPMLRALCALSFSRGCTINPVAFVRGLAKRAEGMGVAVCEGVSVLAWSQEGEAITIKTSHGEVRTRHLFLCRAAENVSLYETMIVTEPVELLRGWSHGEVLANALPLPDCSRWLPDGRILFTSGRTRGLSSSDQTLHESALLLRRLFADWYDMRPPAIAATWTRAVPPGHHIFPVLTRKSKNIVVASGGNVDQLALFVQAGISGAKMIQGAPVPYEELFTSEKEKPLRVWAEGVFPPWVSRVAAQVRLDDERADDAQAREPMHFSMR